MQLGQITDNKIQKDQKTQLLLLKSQEQKQCVGRESRVLHMPPAHNTTKGVGRPPKPTLQPNPRHTPTLTPYKEPARPPGGASKGTCYLFLLPPAAAGAPIKPCLISCMASYQFLLIKEGQEPWLVTGPCFLGIPNKTYVRLT